MQNWGMTVRRLNRSFALALGIAMAAVVGAAIAQERTAVR